MIRLGLNTWTWTDMFSEEHIPCIYTMKELGARCIDFSIADPYIFPLKEAKKAIEETGLEVITTTCAPGDAHFTSPHPQVRKAGLAWVKRMIDLTEELGGKLVSGVIYTGSGYLTGVRPTEQEYEWSAEGMRAAAEYALPKGITLAMEPVKRFESHLINRVEQGLAHIERIGMPNVKLHLDTFHMNIEEADPLAAIRLAGDKAAYYHFVDTNRGAPGMGHYDWEAVYQTIKDTGFDGPATIEVFHPTNERIRSLTCNWQKFADTPEELVTIGMEYLKKVEAKIYG